MDITTAKPALTQQVYNDDNFKSIIDAREEFSFLI